MGIPDTTLTHPHRTFGDDGNAARKDLGLQDVLEKGRLACFFCSQDLEQVQGQALINSIRPWGQTLPVNVPYSQRLAVG